MQICSIYTVSSHMLESDNLNAFALNFPSATDRDNNLNCYQMCALGNGNKMKSPPPKKKKNSPEIKEHKKALLYFERSRVGTKTGYRCCAAAAEISAAQWYQRNCLSFIWPRPETTAVMCRLFARQVRLNLPGRFSPVASTCSAKRDQLCSAFVTLAPAWDIK